MYADRNHFWRSSLQIVSLANSFEKPDECGGEVEGHGRLSGLVVPRERVMVIVPTFAQTNK